MDSQCEHGQPLEPTRGVCCMCGSVVARCQSTTPVSLLANEFNVQNTLHGQVSLAAVNQICVIHEAMNGCNNLKIH